jgi:hypothetical protein
VVREVLRSVRPLTGLSKISKTKDQYPLVLMWIEHMVALIEQDMIAPAIALLLLSLSFAALRLETIPSKTRSDLLRISFFLVWELYQARTKGRAPFPETAFQGEKTTVFTSRCQDWPFRLFLKMDCSSTLV